MNYQNEMSYCESDRREQIAFKKQKERKKYNDKRTGRGQGRLGKVVRGLSSSKLSWSKTRQSENVRKESRRNMMIVKKNNDVKLNKKFNKKFNKQLELNKKSLNKTLNKKYK
tara:strand:- start:466 stop:801 length:336 start_codon:yes stop_codon:yes gene_type:complete